MNKKQSDFTNVNHMDMANQIDNKWERDTILSFVNEQKRNNYSLRLRNKDKSTIKKRFINVLQTESTKRHNKKVVNLIFGYMIFKIIRDMKIPITKVIVCPDHRPTKEVHHYIQKIANYCGKPNLLQEVKITFIDRNHYDLYKKTPAHRLAGKALKGKIKTTNVVNSEELIEIISKLL
ncbi:MAG: hypothetical protein ABIC04_05965 [Nanoarchaeota archaeon]